MDLLSVAGIYNGNNLNNAPAPGWIFIQHFQHSNTSDNMWAQQIVTTMGAGSAPNLMFIRTKCGGVWSSWIQK